MAGSIEGGASGQDLHGGMNGALGGSCGKCGGFIGEPGKVYGYAGRWCHCIDLKHASPPIIDLNETIRRVVEQKQKKESAKILAERPKAHPPIDSLLMTPHDFVVWMRGFFSGRTANPVDAKLEAVLRDALSKVRT